MFSLVAIAMLLLFLIRLALRNRYNIYLTMVNQDKLMLIVDQKGRIEIYTDGMKLLFPKLQKSLKLDYFLKTEPAFEEYVKDGEFVLFIKGERYSGKSYVSDNYEIIEIENVSKYLKNGAQSIRELFMDFSQAPLSFRVDNKGILKSASIAFSKYLALFDNDLFQDIADIGIRKESFLDEVLNDVYINGSLSVNVDGLKVFNVYASKIDDNNIFINLLLAGEIIPFSSSHFDVLSTLLNSMDDGLVAVDNNGIITFSNDKMYEIIGVNDLNKRNILDIFKIFDRNNREIKLKFPLVSAVYEYTWLETPFKDTRVVIELVVNEVLELDGFKTGYVLSFRDTSLRRSTLIKSYDFAYRDALTGVYNRHYLKELVTNLHNEHMENFALIIVDCNGLKVINDAFGHKMGDEIIKSTSDILMKIKKDQDNVIRIGGDEFAVVLNDVTETEVITYIRRVENEVSKVRVNRMPLSIAIGSAYHESGELFFSDLLEQAELNMYHDKMLTSKLSRDHLIYRMFEELVERDPYEAVHSKFVSKLSYDLAVALGLGSEMVQLASSAGKYHAIGKIVLNHDVQLAPGDLEARDAYDKHTEYAFRIFSAMPEYSHLANGVLLYKENYDGSGGPHGLAGEEIPISSRILRVSSSVSKLYHLKQPHVKGNQLKDIMHIMEGNAGTLYDPNIVSILADVLSTYDFPK